MILIELVRSIIGIYKERANEIFAKYINDSRLNSKQTKFVKILISYVHKNGTSSNKKRHWEYKWECKDVCIKKE